MNNTELIAQARANIGTSLATSYLLRLADALEAAHPAPQVPMTNGDMFAMLLAIDPEAKRVPPGFIEFARAIEAHHKIGGKP